MDDPHQKKVLVCPLDWGIGHATRCIPVIQEFLDAGFSVTIAAGGRPYELLRKEFPRLKIIRFPGKVISYHKRYSLGLTLLLQVPDLVYGYFKEKLILKKLINLEKPDIVISDNRYGLWNKNVRSVLITHQLKIMMPKNFSIFTPVVNKIIRSMVRNFDECWIPDFSLHNGLAGDLSHGPDIKGHIHYIGTLSRFSSYQTFREPLNNSLLDIMVILSGPEPQRTILEEKIFSQLRNSGLKGIIVRGLTEQNEAFDLTGFIRVYSHLDSQSLRDCIMQSELVICRSGYSSIMDLVALGKKAILIPTPGQTEQEYLARYLMDKKIFFSIPQKNFDLLYAIEMTRNYPGMILRNDHKILRERIQALSQ